jgi:anti-sigma B factor antagonist
MTISTEAINDVVVAKVPGKALDASNSRDFKSATAPLLIHKVKLVLDLEGIDFIDSTGLGALVSCLREAHAHEGEIKLCGLTKRVRALFELVRMHRVFEIFNNPLEATNSYGA